MLPRLTSVILILISFAGCASVCHLTPISPAQIIRGGESNWWYASFRIKWEREEPEWHVDLIIAHRIISPVLNKYKKDIKLWRVHRRAVKDQAGHQFSFIFYCTPRKARAIYDSIRSNPLFEEMKAADLVTQAIFEDKNQVPRPKIESVSDRHWSPPVQKSWPYFIMGVSEMWLRLISLIAEEKTEQPASLVEIQEFYKEVDSSILKLWQGEGSHALLHHLNAIFEYEPTRVHSKYLLRF